MPHQGSGLCWSRKDVLEMPLRSAIATLKRLDERRQKESEAMRAAARKVRRK